MLGEILIGGMASLLICMFLGPKFIDFMREREFGQHIREEGPEGHHEKAGTPTMGGLLILLVDRRAVPDPQRVPRRQPGRARHGARERRARLRRRLDEDREPALARRVRPVQAARAGRDRDRAVVRRHRVRAPAGDPALPHHRRLDRPRPALPGAHLPRARGGDERREPDRRPRRPGRGLGGDRAARLHGDDVHHDRPGGPRAPVRVPGGRVRRVPLVQLVPGGDLHGRHRVAGLRRRHRGARRDDPDRAAPDRDRRHLRDREPVGGDPGDRVPALPPARVPHGARSTTTSS